MKNKGALQGGEEGGEIKGEEAVAEKEGADGPGAQKGGEREAVFEGFAVEEKENTTHQAAAYEGQEGRKKGQFPSQKARWLRRASRLQSPCPGGEEGAGGKKKPKRTKAPERWETFSWTVTRRSTPQKKHYSHGPVEGAKGPKVKESNEKEEGGKKKKSQP